MPDPTNLDMATNQELIEELLRRSSFAGILVWFPDGDAKVRDGDDFTGDMRAHWRNCTSEQAVHNLQLAIKALENKQQ